MARKKADWSKLEPRIITSNKKTALDGSGYFSTPTPYQPEFASPERVQWPADRHQQNRYWRLFYKTDSVIPTVIELFADIISSDFTLTGEGVDGEIKDTYEAMVDATQIVSMFPYFIKEYLVLGEVIPHCIFDKDKKIWTSVLFHNPDQINVIDSPFIDLDPLVEYTPDPALRELVRSKHPVIQQVMAKMPPELLSAITTGRNVPLDTSLNATFIARKVHPYDVRGTGILSRLFRILMYEDAIVNASIATARRHAGPLKIAKLGDKQLNYIPEQEYQDKIMELLAVAESDPHSFLILPWFVNFEAFGTTERMMNIRQEWDIIERVKLTALGVSQGFLHGEATYASMRGNMQTLLMKLRGLRTFFETVWWYPKFFKPIAEMNEFVKPTTAEVKHRLRFRRSKKELLEDNRYAIPKIQWSRSLDPKVDAEMLDAFEQIVSRLNLPISKQAIYSTVGLDHETEFKNVLQEQQLEEELTKELGVSLKQEEGEGGGGGGGFGGMPAGEPGGEEGAPEEGAPEEGEEAPAEGEPESVPEASKVSRRKVALKLPFTAQEIRELEVFIKTGETESEFWGRLDRRGSEDIQWEHVEEFLDEEGYSPKDAKVLKRYLENRKALRQTKSKLNNYTSKLHENMSDKELSNAVGDILRTKQAEKSLEDKHSAFFVGEGNHNRLKGDR